MLSDIVTAIESACTTLGKEFLFGTIASDLNSYSKSYSELIFLQIPFNNSFDQNLLRNGSGNLGYTLDLYALQKYNQAQQATTTKQAAWDASTTSIISVINQACTNDRNLKRSIVGNQTASEILTFGANKWITTRVTLNFSQYWQC